MKIGDVPAQLSKGSKSMAKGHSFSLKGLKPQRLYSGGSRTSITANELPILSGISFSIIKLAPGCAREPHWHPNAGELTYCLKGKALVTIFSPKNEHSTFTLDVGEVFFAPKGYMHHIANISQEEGEYIVAFSDSKQEDINLSDCVNCMPPHVLSTTFGISPTFFEKIHSVKNVFATPKQVAEKPIYPSIPSHFKLNLEKVNPQIITNGGSAKIANKHSFPILEDLALFSLRIKGEAVREPHWHPNASELNYVVSGKARLIILSPGGEVDTFEIGPGEGSYIPASYYHYIENLSTEELHMTVFFSNSEPSDIGISGAMSAYSNELLAGVFNVPPEYFKELPRFQEDVLVVAGGG